MNKRIHLSPPHMSGNEMKYINEAFEQNWIAPIGPNVDAFENELANYLGVKHVAAVSSGTAAIHLALINLGVKAADEVIVQSLTFSGTINPILYQDATPIIIDSETDTWNMCPELLKTAIEDRISKGKKPKAIIAVNIYGMPAKLDLIEKIAQEYEIPLIEDAAESLGSRFNNKMTASFGQMGILSFNGNKIITTSGGGALVSDNEDFIKNARHLATQARDNFPYYHHTKIGYNYRMSNVLAGIGRGQLEVIEDRVNAKRDIFEFYKMVFKDIEGVSFCDEPENAYSNFWLSCVLIDPEKTKGIKNIDLISALDKENIEARHIWKPMHTQPIFSKCPAYTKGVSEKIFEQGVCLPSGSGMSDQDMARIAKTIIEVFKN